MASRRMRQIVSAIVNQPMLLTAEKLNEICGFLTRRSAGEQLTQEEIQARFAIANSDEDEDDDGPVIIDGVQLIQVFGTLGPRMNLMTRISGGTSTQLLESEVLDAIRNPKVRAIGFEIDSPGGSAQGTPEAARVMLKARGHKRTFTIARNQMASGALWLGTAVDHVYATESTQVGSHGVYTVVQTYNQRADGDKFEVLRAGKLKAAGIPYGPLTAEGPQSIQAVIDSIFVQFTAALAEHRRVSQQTVLDQFGQGASFLAGEAKERGMVDEVGLFDDILQKEVDRSRATASLGVRFQIQTKGDAMKVSQRVKALLFGRGLIDDMEASDELCTTVLKSFLSARGVAWTEDEAAICGELMREGTQKLNEVAITSVATQLKPTDVTAEVRRAAIEERHRINELTARGELFGVSSEAVQAAIDAGKSVGDVIVEWSDSLAKKKGNAIVGNVDINVGPQESDKFVDAACEVLVNRMHIPGVKADEKILQGAGASLRRTSMLDMGRQCLKMAGIRPSGDPEADGNAILQLGGTDLRILASQAGADSPGRHPDLLSNLMGKILDKGYPEAGADTFMQWAEQLEDLTDFKPRSVIETGIFGELDIRADDEIVKQKVMDSGLTSFIQAEEYENASVLSLRMVLNDDLGGFGKQLASYPRAGMRTLNNTCIRLLAGNFNMIDGQPMFSAPAGNLIIVGQGGPPSASQAAKMRTLHRLQKNVGPEGAKVPLNEAPDRALIPATLEESGLQTFTFVEPKQAAPDSNLNTVRGTITPYFEAYLDEFNLAEWYTFIPIAVHGCVAYAYMAGYGAGGRRSTWFDNMRGSRWFKFEQKFGVTAKSRKGVVKNSGS